MKPVIFIPGEREKFSNYVRAVERSGGSVRFDTAEDCAGSVRFDTAEDCAESVRFDTAEDCAGSVRFDTAEDCAGSVRFSVAEDCAGLLLPGGGDMEPWRYGQVNVASRNLDPARDALELDLLERFAALRKPILGICRGMQSVNVFFGGTLLQDIPGHAQVNGADRMHTIRNALGIFSKLGAERVNSAHHQAVDRLGNGLRAGQWAADGVIEALTHERLPVWGVQWHPERLDDPAGERLFRAFLDLCAASG